MGFLNLGSLLRHILIILTIFMCVVLVSYGCCNKLPQARCLRAMNIYFLTASGIWSNSSEAEMECGGIDGLPFLLPCLGLWIPLPFLHLQSQQSMISDQCLCLAGPLR